MTISRRDFIWSSAALGLSTASLHAADLGPKPNRLETPVKLSTGILKVAHLAPFVRIPEILASMNVELTTAEFVRYADARTALASGSLDIAAVGPPDLGILLSQGQTNAVALMGVGTQPKYPVVRKGVTVEKWSDLSGKRVAVAPASTVWFQFTAMLDEVGVPYTSLQPINIQGGGSSFNLALKRGDVDVAIIWEPFESQAVFEGDGHFAKQLDYSKSKAVGADLGVIMATKQAVNDKREAVKRFIWAYAEAQRETTQSKERFAEAISAYTGIQSEIAKLVAENIALAPDLSIDQMKRQAATFHKFGVIPKDVSGEIDKYYPADFVASALRGV